MLLTEAVKDGQSLHRFLDELLELELSQREERRIKTSLRLSSSSTGADAWELRLLQPSVEKSRVETLATCGWIREDETVLIQGPPGVGKTHVAVGLGVKAIENAFSVAFFQLEDLLHVMKQTAALSPKTLRRKKYLNVALSGDR